MRCPDFPEEGGWIQTYKSLSGRRTSYRFVSHAKSAAAMMNPIIQQITITMVFF